MGEVKAFPFERCPKVTRAEVNAQPERQRVRIAWCWLAERLASSFARAQPDWGWHARDVRIDGPFLQHEIVLPPQVGRGSHTQALMADADRSSLLVNYESLLITALLGLDGVSTDAQQNGLGIGWGTHDLSYLDGLTIDALADIESYLPPNCGLHFHQSGTSLERHLRAFRIREQILIGHLGFGFCPPGASPRVAYAKFFAPRRCLRTAFGDALEHVATKNPLYWLPKNRTQTPFRLIFGVGRLSFDNLTRLTPDDVLCLSGGATRFQDTRTQHWGFEPCWLGWSSPRLSAWWTASLVIRAQGFSLKLSQEGPQIMSKDQSPPPKTTVRRAHQTQELLADRLDDFVSQAPVEISFELTRVTLTTEQLALAHSGDVIELDLFLRSPIQVMLGSHRIGEGELVDVDGKLGVRLLWVGDKRPHP